MRESTGKKEIDYFYLIRDIPYRIPLYPGDEDDCCNGKHLRLYAHLKEIGLEARFRECTFYWNNLNLPEKLLKIPHQEECEHIYLEFYNPKREMWLSLDATWDYPLRTVFPINEWDGESATQIAVYPIKMYSVKETEARLAQDKEKELEIFKKDIEISGQFYKAFNEWLEEIRQISSL
jgi:hypothetical protein